MKKAFTFLCALFLLTFKAQQASYIEGTLKVEGVPAFIASKLDMSIKALQKDNKSLFTITRPDGVQTKLTVGEKVTVTDKKDCYSDSKSEIAKYNDDDYSIENFTATETGSTREIAGYKCNSRLFTYVTRAKGYATEQSTTVWYTAESIAGIVNSPSAITGTDNDNDYSRAMVQLPGIVMSAETVTKSTGMKTIFMVSKIELRNADDGVFNIDLSKCKKMMNYREFMEEMKRRQIKSSMMGY